MSTTRSAAVVGIAVVIVVLLSVLAASGGVSGQEDVVTITVTVENRNGEPVSDAELTATWEDGEDTAVTRSNGKAFMDVSAGEEVTIAIEHEDYTRNSPYTIDSATEEEITIDVARKGQLVVTATHNDAAVQDAEVVIRKDGQRVVDGQTTAMGEFESGVIEQGEYTVSVVKPGYFKETYSVTVDPFTTHEASLERGSVLLSVRVVDDFFEEPEAIENARVEMGDAATVSTLNNGEATARVPVNTWIQVTVSKDEYTSMTQNIHISESDREVTLTVNRQPNLTVIPNNDRVVVGEQLTITVFDEYENPVEGATVQLNGQDVGETDERGSVTVRIDESGEQEIVVTHGELESAPVTVRGIADVTATDTPTETSSPTSPTESTPPVTTTPTETDSPGFGVVLALIALSLSAFLVKRQS